MGRPKHVTRTWNLLRQQTAWQIARNPSAPNCELKVEEFLHVKRIRGDQLWQVFWIERKLLQRWPPARLLVSWHECIMCR